MADPGTYKPTDGQVGSALPLRPLQNPPRDVRQVPGGVAAGPQRAAQGQQRNARPVQFVLGHQGNVVRTVRSKANGQGPC